MKKYQWATWSLVLNVLGFLLLFVAFQATSSDLAIYSNSKDKIAALCYAGSAMVMLDMSVPRGRTNIGISPQFSPCSSGKPTAIVNTDYPLLGKIGILFVFVSFWMQYKSIDRTEATLTKTQLRTLKNLGLFSDST
jgi:hypothetical protein